MTDPPPSPSTHEDLARLLSRIDGRGYKAYKEIKGRWAFPDFTLLVDHVQGDPYAAPSRVRVRVPAAVTGLPEEVCRPGPRAVGTACLLARRFAEVARREGSRRGSGKSGEIRIEAPGQQVIPNTAVMVEADGTVEARFRVGLPARGRRVLGRQGTELLVDDVGAIVEAALLAEAYEPGKLRAQAFLLQYLHYGAQVLGYGALAVHEALPGPSILSLETPDPIPGPGSHAPWGDAREGVNDVVGGGSG